MPRKSLVEAIEQDALDSSTDLPSVLRKCITLGGQAGSVALRDWATRELKGYQDVDELPAYRHAVAPLLFDGSTMTHQITGQMLSADLIPSDIRDDLSEDIEFRQPIAEIIAMTRSRGSKEPVRWAVPGQSYLLPLVNHQEGIQGRIERIYWAVSPITVGRVVDVVRTVLVEMLAEMRAGTPRGEATPTAEVADRAVNLAVRGIGNRIVYTNAPGASGPITTTVGGRTNTGSSEPESRSRSLMFWLGGLATIAAAVFAAITIWV